MLALAGALLLGSAATLATANATPLACRVLSAAEVARALGHPAAQSAAIPSADQTDARTSNCAWTLTDTPQTGITLTIDRHPPAQLPAAWQSALDTYLHAGRMIRGAGAPAMWVPNKWGTTALLYLKGRDAVVVLTLPHSSAHDLRAAKALARLIVSRLTVYNKQ